MLSLTKTQVQQLVKSIPSDRYFINNIFSHSFEKFVRGEHINWTADFLQRYLKTVRVSAKDHFKSCSLYAKFMKEMVVNADTKFDREYHYFSYTARLAGYHIKKIKTAVRENPFFVDLIDEKTQAEGIIKYRWHGTDKFFTMEPQGLMEFKRGIHCNGGVFVDDPFQDPDRKVDPVKIKKINNVMKTQVIDIPNEGAFLHIVGTAQTKEDFFFDKKFLKRFETKVLPAIKSFKTKEVLWPEWMDWDELMERREERGIKVFGQEYLCKPYYTGRTFIGEEQMDEMCSIQVTNPDGFKSKHDIIGCYDLGKKVHPGYHAIWEVEWIGDDKTRWKQLHFKFYDGVDYTDQLADIAENEEKFKVDRTFYDDTRGELEGFRERGELPNHFEPIVFSLKMKNKSSTDFDALITRKDIKMIDDDRQKRSLDCVMDDLVTLETSAGHGEAFWGTCLALQYLQAKRIAIY